MGKKFSFTLGNMSLLPSEFNVIDVVNSVLSASAKKHGIVLKDAAFIEIKSFEVNGNTIYRAAPKGKDPVDIPLACV